VEIFHQAVSWALAYDGPTSSISRDSCCSKVSSAFALFRPDKHPGDYAVVDISVPRASRHVHASFSMNRGNDGNAIGNLGLALKFSIQPT
jgi:hypothetical protein